MIAGIILAAGESRRFGSNKLLHPVDGRPMVCHVVVAADSSVLDAVYVVTGHDADRVRTAIGEVVEIGERVVVIENDKYRSGSMSSVKCGLSQLSSSFDAAMVLLSDMPYVSSQTIDRMIAVFEKKSAFVVATASGRPTHPRIIPRAYFERFNALGDDEKGQAIIQSIGYTAVEVPDASGRDIDHPFDVD